MALTRKLLKGLGLTEEQVDTIIEAHTDTVDSLKADLSTYKTDAEKYENVQKELDELKSKADDGYKEKYEQINRQFEDFKAETTAKETKTAKTNAYRELLKNAGISEKRIETVLKVSDIDGIELDENGKIKDADERMASVKTEWADFVVATETVGAETANPPANNPTEKDPFELGFDGE